MTWSPQSPKGEAWTLGLPQSEAWVPQSPQGEAWAPWLLRDGVWGDGGQWSDIDYWIDSPRPTWSVQAAQSEVWTDAGSV